LFYINKLILIVLIIAFEMNMITHINNNQIIWVTYPRGGRAS